jgi:hypothetical protein
MARRTHDPSDRRGVVAYEQLDEGAAGIVADKRDVVEVEAIEELGHEPGGPAQGKVCVAAHRVAMRAERLCRGDAAVVGRELGDHVVPEGGVHHQAVQEHDRRSFATGVPVLDRSGGELDPTGGRGRRGCADSSPLALAEGLLIRGALLSQPLQAANSASASSSPQETYVVSTLTITTATRLPFGRETATLR